MDDNNDRYNMNDNNYLIVIRYIVTSLIFSPISSLIDVLIDKGWDKWTIEVLKNALSYEISPC